jgi:type I restriction enzyme S subunit
MNPLATKTLEYPNAFAVWFSDLNRWDASSFHRIQWHWPEKMLAPIGSVLRLRKERVDKSKTQFVDLQPITIHFNGSMDKRIVDAGREYSMDLWFARPGDIVVAKIDLKNGAVGIVPPDWNNVVVTGHFAVYEPDRARLVPEYLHRIVQTRFFKAHLWRNKVGAEGRKEVKLDFFESERIPLPPVPQQKSIVARYHEAQRDILATFDRVSAHRRSIDERVFADLGLVPPKTVVTPKCFAVKWVDFRRWGVASTSLTLSMADLSQGLYPIRELGSLVALIQYGTSAKANISGDGAAVIRMNNLVDGQLDLSNLKHVRLPQREVDKLLLKDGDILFNRTNSKELVGKCAVFHAQGSFVFASYLIRVRTDSKEADPDFVAYILNSPIGRQQIDAVSRPIIGQANINSEELRSFQIPLPPLRVQRQIMERVAKGRSEILQESQSADQIAVGIRDEIEALILGTRKIGKV